MISGYRLFQLDRVVKLHFTSDYNIFDYNGRVNGAEFENFLKKRDYDSYNRLAIKFESEIPAIQYLTANYAYKNPSPIHNLALCEDNYILWEKRKQSISNTFKEDISKIVLYLEKNDITYESLFSVDNDLPTLFKMYLGDYVTVETLHILNKINPYLSEWRQQHSLIWKADFLIIEKLDRFVKINLTSASNTVRELTF